MIRIALCLGLALVPGLAAAESLQEALIGSWAKVASSQISDDAMVTMAHSACAVTGFGDSQGVVMAAEGKAISLEVWRRGEALIHWDFDEEVRGGRLEDGRLLLQFSVAEIPTVEMTYWRISVGDAEQSLIHLLGPGSEPAIYLKCP